MKPILEIFLWTHGWVALDICMVWLRDSWPPRSRCALHCTSRSSLARASLRYPGPVVAPQRHSAVPVAIEGVASALVAGCLVWRRRSLHLRFMGLSATPELPDEALLAQARDHVARARRVVVLTGAGISTDSGVPDFRGPSGVWTKDPSMQRLVDLDAWLNEPDIRVHRHQ